MDFVSNKKSIPLNVRFGLTAAGTIGCYAVFFAAASGLSLVFALVCCISCALFSVKTKGNVLAPHPFLIVPITYAISVCSEAGAVLSLAIAALLFFICQKLQFEINIPQGVYSGTMLGFALATTILLTNVYFGIGAYGATPFEMLASYRYLGFHPNFMGLLTGTITLFTMITYPFKFRKISKIVPPVFITVFIPYVLNLFLNPNPKYTTINEATSLGTVADFPIVDSIRSVNSDNANAIVHTTFALFFLFLLLCHKQEKKNKEITGLANVFSCIPSAPHKQENFTFASAITTIIICCGIILLLPSALHRIPMHSIGAMLIVAGWQSVPFKEIGSCFKSKNLSTIVSFLLCASSFIVLKPFTATIVCVALSVFFTPQRKEKKNAD